MKILLFALISLVQPISDCFKLFDEVGFSHLLIPPSTYNTPSSSLSFPHPHLLSPALLSHLLLLPSFLSFPFFLFLFLLRLKVFISPFLL